MGVDEALRHRRVHVPRGRLPDQNWIGILAVVLAIGVPQGTAPAVRRRGTQQHGLGDRCHAGPDGVDHFDVGGCSALVGRPVGKLVEQCRDDAVAAGGAEGCGVDFHDDAVLQRDALARYALDLLLEHRHGFQQAEAVAHDDPRLPAIGGDDHDGTDFARTQEGTPVLEAGQEDGDDRENERLAAASTDDQPGLMQRTRWWCVAPGVQLVDLELLRCHRQPKQRGQEHEPALPGFRTAEVLAEHALIGNGIVNIHGPSP
jgi:hypothetical protein